MSDFIYLDNGATSFPKPEAVYAFMDSFYRTNGASPGRAGHDMSLASGDILHETRQMMTDFLGGTDPSRLVFGLNSTDALNLALFGLLGPGDHVVTTTLEHNAVLRPLTHLAEDRGVEVDYVPFDERGFVDPAAIAARFKSNTKLVAVNHASNVIGTVQPVAEIGALCRERGILFLVDASQSAGKVDIDVGAMHIDVLAFTGHKSLLGPVGVGGMYVAEGVDIRHTRAGGTGVKSAHRRHLEEYPYRMEYGTLNMLGIAGLHAGLTWVLEQGVHELHRREMALTERFVRGLNAIEGVTTYCLDDLTDHIAVASFNVDGFEAVDTGTLLDGEYDIACRTGLQCAPLVHEQLGTAAIGGTVRAGFGPFNTNEHVDRALAAVAEVAAMKRGMSRAS